jgi:DivIVA domain-containing protein
VPVTGDEVRNTRFRLSVGGYDAPQVDDLLRRIAVELDAGRPAGPLIADATLQPAGMGLRSPRGYDIDAVDWFLDRLRSAGNHGDRAGEGADPWRDLAVVNYFTRRGAGDLADRAAAPSRQARRKYENQDLEYLARECADAWRDFGQQPGTHLRWVRAGAVRRELRTAEQQTLASLRYSPPTTISTGGRTFTWKRVTGSSWPDIAEIIRRSRREAIGRHFGAVSTPQEEAIRKDGPAARTVLQLRELLDETGTPILYTSGQHLAQSAAACITFPGQRWLRFPVRSTDFGSRGWKNGIMTAVDQDGNKVARYRIPRKGYRGRYNLITSISGAPGQVEITVHPDRQLTDELVLAIAISAPWVGQYFNPGGEG